MKLRKKRDKEGWITTVDQLAEIIGSRPEEINIKPKPVFSHRTKDLTIWFWTDGDNRGFLRSDASGWSSICLGNSRDDELALAAWNTDLDIRQLKRWAGNDAIKNALIDAREREMR